MPRAYARELNVDVCCKRTARARAVARTLVSCLDSSSASRRSEAICSLVTVCGTRMRQTPCSSHSSCFKVSRACAPDSGIARAARLGIQQPPVVPCTTRQAPGTGWWPGCAEGLGELSGTADQAALRGSDASRSLATLGSHPPVTASANASARDRLLALCAGAAIFTVEHNDNPLRHRQILAGLFVSMSSLEVFSNIQHGTVRYSNVQQGTAG